MLTTNLHQVIPVESIQANAQENVLPVRGDLRLADSNAADTASSASSRSWRDRVSVISMEMAKSLCTDVRISSLDPEALGVLIRIHAMSRLGRGVPEDMVVAARILKTTKRKLEPAIALLVLTVPDLLVVANGVYTVPSLNSDEASRNVIRSNQKRNASMVRWAKSMQEVNADLALDNEIKKNKPKKRAKKLQADTLENLGTQEQARNAATPSKDGRAADCPYQALADAFNTTAKALVRVNESKTWSHGRKSAMSNRWKERPDVNFWREKVFARVQCSDFLTGRQATSPWQCSFDWIIKPANLQKILEGNYDNRGGTRRGLWDQGDKSRDTEMLSKMDSEIDAGAPFLRAKPEVSAKDSIETTPAASAVFTPAVRAQPFQGTGAGPAPAGFGVRKQTVVNPVKDAIKSHSNEPSVSTPNAPVKVMPAAKFTPDQLRASLNLQAKKNVSVAIAPVISTPPVAEKAPQAIKRFSFRTAE